MTKEDKDRVARWLEFLGPYLKDFGLMFTRHMEMSNKIALFRVMSIRCMNQSPEDIIRETRKAYKALKEMK